MALIVQEAMKYDEFRKIAETITYTIEKSDTLNNTLELWNHSKILRENTEFYYKYAKGSKTGYTRAALNTLVTYGKKDKTELICVVLKDYGADSSYHDTKALFKWGFDNVKGIRPLTDVDLGTMVSSSEDLTDAQIKSIKALKTSFNNKYYVLVPKKLDADSIDVSFELDPDDKSNVLGYMNISYDDDVIGKTPVTYEGTFDVSGKGDDLETAPNSDTSLRPHKVLKFLLKVLIAIVLIFIIMTIIRSISARRTAQRNLKRRKKARTRRRAKNDNIK
jgi:D-alanyl-D-alanine carboxypeptidase